MNTKRKGSRNERRSMALLEAAGYSCTKSGASLGCFDIIAIGSTDIICCQVKSNRPAPAHEMETMKNFVCPPNCRKLLHIWMDRQRQPVVKEIK